MRAACAVVCADEWGCAVQGNAGRAAVGQELFDVTGQQLAGALTG